MSETVNGSLRWNALIAALAVGCCFKALMVSFVVGILSDIMICLSCKGPCTRIPRGFQVFLWRGRCDQSLPIQRVMYVGMPKTMLLSSVRHHHA